MSAEYSYEGLNYGNVVLNGKTLAFSSGVSEKPVFELDLSSINQCVVPTNNVNDIEIQFGDTQKREKKEDCLVSISFHFPNSAEELGEDEEPPESAAQLLQQQIMGSGVLRSATGDVVIEFTKDEGNFTFPRGKYALQFTPTHMVMQGGQYSYRIAYTNIELAYMLKKTEKDRIAFVLPLITPIRQGNQKYKCLVLETHELEETKKFTMPEDQLQEKFGIDSTEISKPMAHIFGKVLKDIGHIKVVIPKVFKSSSDAPCVRCSIKANDGYLYPAAKCFIFITKPTIIINYDDIQSIEFLRYDNTKNAATRNFEMQIKMKSSSKDNDKEKEKEYLFAGIYRTEYPFLNEHVKSKEITIDNPFVPTVEGLDGDDDDEDEEDDDDYAAGSGSGSGSGSDDSDDDSKGGSESESGDVKPITKSKAVKKGGSDKDKVVKKRKAEPEKGGKEKKKRQKKDKNAPKRATTAFMAYSNSIRSQVQKENPGMKITDISKEIGIRWKALSAEDRAPFDEMANSDKVRYAAEMKAYKSKGGEVVEIDGSEPEDGEDA